MRLVLTDVLERRNRNPASQYFRLAYNLLLRKTGLFLVQLRVTSGKDDPLPPDLHVALYDGKCVRDNQWYTKVKMIEDSDRNVQGARLVFDSLFHGLEVRINNIYELTRA